MFHFLPTLTFDAVFISSLFILTIWMISCSLMLLKIICALVIINLHFQLGLLCTPMYYTDAYLKSLSILVSSSNLVCQRKILNTFPKPAPVSPISVFGNFLIPVVQASKLALSSRHHLSFLRYLLCPT